jgi:hypothetical protein
MDTDESRTMHRGRTAVAALFLPRTRQGRLGSLGLIMVLAAELMPMPANVFVALLADPVLIWALVVAVRDRRRRNRHLTARRALAITARVIAGYLLFSVVFVLGTQGLATLVANGSPDSGTQITGSVRYYLFEIVIALAIVGVLVWVPAQLFKMNLDMERNEEVRRVLLGLITAAASVLTGIYILMLHLGGGQLSKVNGAQLIAGMVFTLVLVGPFYRSLARAFWQRGISGIFSLRVMRRHWDEALTEIQEALNRADGHGGTISLEPGHGVGMTIQGADDAPTEMKALAAQDNGRL